MSVPERLQDSEKGMPKEHFELCCKLYNLGQAHIFEEWDIIPMGERKALAKQLFELDEEYSAGGGLPGYIENAKKLLADSQKGVNPLADWKPEVPVGEAFSLGTPEYAEAEELGMKQLGSVGFVLVAGGLGERLGYSSIKIGLPTEMATETRYLHYYINYILAVQKKYAPEGRDLPLCIMTSNDTHAKTVQLLKVNKYFGMKKSQVTIVIQGQGVPALADNDAKFVLQESDPSKVVTKPHGHGDIHALLHQNEVAKKWKEEMGIEWMCLFQDTNGLAFHTLPVMLGVSSKLDLIMNSLAVPRKAKQAIGAVTKLKNTKTGEYRTINVEYNQLDPLLRASGFKDGDVNDKKTGFSPYPGNINQLVFKLEDYVELLEATSGLMPEFVNPKYKDDKKTIFKKPTRLECMMQDFPTVISAEKSERVGFTSIAAEMCFSPVKNATADGVVLQGKGTAAGTAATGEADHYQAYRKILQSIGCQVEEAEPETYKGISVIPGPQVVVYPEFASCPGEYKAKFPTPEKVKISPKSTLIIRGPNVTINSLDLDGTLIIDVPAHLEVSIEDLEIKNDGWHKIAVDDDEAKEIIKMRGYKMERKKQAVIKKQRDVVKAAGGADGEWWDVSDCAIL